MYEKESKKITKIVEEIYKGNSSPTLNEIYEEFDKCGLTHIYSVGVTLRDYLDSLIAIGALTIKESRFYAGKHKLTMNKKINKHIIDLNGFKYDYSWMICKDKDKKEHFKIPIQIYHNDDEYKPLMSGFKKIKGIDKQYALCFIGQYYLPKKMLNEDIYYYLQEMIYECFDIEIVQIIENVCEILIADFDGEDKYYEHLKEIAKYYSDNDIEIDDIKNKFNINKKLFEENIKKLNW